MTEFNDKDQADLDAMYAEEAAILEDRLQPTGPNGETVAEDAK